MHYKVMNQMTLIPRLLKDLATHKQGDGNAQNIYLRTTSIATQLKRSDEFITRLLVNRTYVRTKESSDANPLVSQVYFCNGIEVPSLCVHHAMLSIIINRILIALGQCQASIPNLDEQNLTFSNRIWMMHEHVRNLKPLGFQFYISPLIVSFESADTKEKQDWIVELLNDLQVGSVGRDDLWTKERTMFRCLGLSGRMPLLWRATQWARTEQAKGRGNEEFYDLCWGCCYLECVAGGVGKKNWWCQAFRAWCPNGDARHNCVDENGIFKVVSTFDALKALSHMFANAWIEEGAHVVALPILDGIDTVCWPLIRKRRLTALFSRVHH
jgi:hypothetical protein